ncbi:MAG TPA: TIGR01777 family oxidoreductase [Acidobacteriaceae bacterium]|jgi:hypothetical protein|nr:TIGR01777 family oxidoreductase [Acidobacteriaceae bacterium]
MTMDGENKEKVVLSGSSGMLGSAIGTALKRQGVPVLRLVRRQPRNSGEVQWNPATGQIDAQALEGVTAAVHLSGANVTARRWTKGYKREMRDSRIQTTRLLAETLAQLSKPPRVLITASAIGIYGNRGDEILDEDSQRGQGYFPELCTAWETAARPAEEAGIRVVHLRFGMVIGKDGGAMARLSPLFRLGLGGRLGSGKQWMSWVSEADVVAAALFALKNANLAGPVNVVAPEPVTNTEFTRELGRAVHRPALLPAPAFALRLAFGEMADEALLASSRVIPKRLQQAGFVFAHPTLAEAFAAALGK